MEPYWESMVFATGNSYESGAGLDFEDLPASDEPLYLLGQSYSSLYDREEIRCDFLSRLWVSYRRDFASIGGSSGPTSDKGWGCMLRCGQMMFAEALVRAKLGRLWRWSPNSYVNCDLYRQILHLFQDTEAACYSIHKIASMGVADGRRIGEWFGPNTVAQAIKKLTVFDSFSDASVYVALDNAIIIDQFKELLKHRTEESKHEEGEGSSVEPDNVIRYQRPMLLIIPLRLGLSDLNVGYVPALKQALQLPHSLGIIGGKPNHAHYFIGYQGDELLYLDPHTTQPYVDFSNLNCTAQCNPADSSYHCSVVSRMPFSKLDPSIALGFVCTSEADLHDLCASLVRRVIQSNPLALFEIHQQIPKHWPSVNDVGFGDGGNLGDLNMDSDDEDETYVLIDSI